MAMMVKRQVGICCELVGKLSRPFLQRVILVLQSLPGFPLVNLFRDA